jgi:hypothetical protein
MGGIRNGYVGCGRRNVAPSTGGNVGRPARPARRKNRARPGPGPGPRLHRTTSTRFAIMPMKAERGRRIATFLP